MGGVVGGEGEGAVGVGGCGKEGMGRRTVRLIVVVVCCSTYMN